MPLTNQCFCHVVSRTPEYAYVYMWTYIHISPRAEPQIRLKRQHPVKMTHCNVTRRMGYPPEWKNLIYGPFPEALPQATYRGHHRLGLRLGLKLWALVNHGTERPQAKLNGRAVWFHAWTENVWACWAHRLQKLTGARSRELRGPRWNLIACSR